MLGPLALGLLVGASRVVSGITGLTIPDPLGTISFSVAALLALWLALEGAMVQRYGLETMDRGGPFQRVARYLLVTVTTLAGLIVAIRFLALSLPWAFETQNTPAQALGVLLVVALVATLYRILTAARDGYLHSSEQQQEEAENSL
ncbi:hypothetical protein [Haloarcula japonica]|uniref:Uncharacterized protein n=1 Tax=Haloarcula japonica (strain ATCC 49778 / DSM 6131 / JCM 7785 / NBRC 101032 / NCIMB 13157 / TR-1) TaxID=1227453 RepID=M0L6L9_HALJT|nr:hypothetical protein [Haloarcula japonica]EMA29242.1 hypothetical protein C444_14516 [Haloarcula japonica DSM 6131]